MRNRTARLATAVGLAAATMLASAGCVAGESGPAAAGAAEGSEWSTTELTIDFATYNPLSLVVRDQGLIEERLGDSVEVTWLQSAGSNKANEALRSGALDVGSTAGSAALLARANGSPIKTIDVYSQPEWAAIAVSPDSGITSVADLAGRSVAATKGTDPYFFLLQALEEAGVDPASVEVQNLQHADGRAALDNGSVDAWSGLDPILAAAEHESGAELLYRNVDFNTYGFLNATEDFVENHPDVAQVVVDAYEEARAWAIENPEQVSALLAEVAGIAPEVATTVIEERTHLDIDPVPGDAQRQVLEVVGPIFVENGDVASQEAVDAALGSLFETRFAQEAVS
ncbi:aliphatic sulfonates ABC transporter substrate-binding protein [Xylanimonas oleitrophica]|uniref:Putative aliphatic sulfonates-binding protein n=1 Tax=Xylanimonas oleitrophica TaxID=2607479 RepID=A0A2W5XSS1_9MICO|nr:aliphatic sulfonate ABC transporter substrate-binding protein [Xylanimonas oleitrophica]PZR52968.1 aliphatic sulfonates ABC transporter substrate-binding protein [Xylanimonas oleitrophica]